DWKILTWNIRGLNGQDKWVQVQRKIKESGCSIICLQETKRTVVDNHFIHNFCPKRFNKFDYLPSNGRFSETPVDVTDFSLSVEFKYTTSNKTWILTNIYGPCSDDRKVQFAHWLQNNIIPDHVEGLIVGDFN
ncbi:hypothetical protein BRADI_1g14572v3, partial [Brachypodium distachyon]